jgi:asparagine synthetase B (glutamine-hydrolysing)
LLISGDTSSSRLAILFSGGIDSMILTALADKILPIEYSVDLLNVAFSNTSNPTSFDVPDRKTGLNGLAELLALSPRRWNFVEIDVKPEEIRKYELYIYSLIYPCCTIMDMTIGTALWFAARGKGILQNL